MEITGTEVTDDVMNKWVKEDMGKVRKNLPSPTVLDLFPPPNPNPNSNPHPTPPQSSQKATADLDQWNGLNSKLTMMETLMKEIEIREKKKMAERLEDKAKAAIAKAEREKKVEEALKVED